jgi:hypothetical protein
MVSGTKVSWPREPFGRYERNDLRSEGLKLDRFFTIVEPEYRPCINCCTASQGPIMAGANN